MKKIILILLGVFLTLPISARDFTYEYEGQRLTYTVTDEGTKTFITKNGSYETDGNTVSGELIIP
ncbi:MAG: hypothetical protein K2M00_02230 [Muribaculaceae bacterium]|nr:hypothetical protein [Muribaculaceae bacterium]